MTDEGNEYWTTLAVQEVPTVAIIISLSNKKKMALTRDGSPPPNTFPGLPSWQTTLSKQ